jgi:hypothetical protein
MTYGAMGRLRLPVLAVAASVLMLAGCGGGGGGGDPALKLETPKQALQAAIAMIGSAGLALGAFDDDENGECCAEAVAASSTSFKSSSLSATRAFRSSGQTLRPSAARESSASFSPKAATPVECPNGGTETHHEPAPGFVTSPVIPAEQELSIAKSVYKNCREIWHEQDGAFVELHGTAEFGEAETEDAAYLYGKVGTPSSRFRELQKNPASGFEQVFHYFLELHTAVAAAGEGPEFDVSEVSDSRLITSAIRIDAALRADAEFRLVSSMDSSPYTDRIKFSGVGEPFFRLDILEPGDEGVEVGIDGKFFFSSTRLGSDCASGSAAYFTEAGAPLQMADGPPQAGTLHIESGGNTAILEFGPTSVSITLNDGEPEDLVYDELDDPFWECVFFLND